MLVIRLARTGRNKYPTYRIVAAESARAATGKHIEVLGHYNPHTKELVLDKDGITKRMSQGAQPSNTVVKLLTREKVELPKWVVLKTKAPKPVEAVVAAETTEAPTTEEAADTDVTEAEAAAEADATAPEAEVRVAEVTEETAAEAGDDVPNADDTETAATEEAATAEAEAADDNGAAAAEKPAE